MKSPDVDVDVDVTVKKIFVCLAQGYDTLSIYIDVE